MVRNIMNYEYENGSFFTLKTTEVENDTSQIDYQLYQLPDRI